MSKAPAKVDPDAVMQRALTDMASHAEDSWLDQLLCDLLCHIVERVCRTHGGLCDDGFYACSVAAAVAQSENSKRMRTERAKSFLKTCKSQIEASKKGSDKPGSSDDE